MAFQRFSSQKRGWLVPRTDPGVRNQRGSVKDDRPLHSTCRPPRNFAGTPCLYCSVRWVGCYNTWPWGCVCGTGRQVSYRETGVIAARDQLEGSSHGAFIIPSLLLTPGSGISRLVAPEGPPGCCLQSFAEQGGYQWLSATGFFCRASRTHSRRAVVQDWHLCDHE